MLVKVQPQLSESQIKGLSPVWLLRWIFRRQALSYCLLQPGKEQEKSSCSLKWARLWEKRALTVMNVFSEPALPRLPRQKSIPGRVQQQSERRKTPPRTVSALLGLSLFI